MVKPKLFLHVRHILFMERVLKTPDNKKFRVEWICFSCGRRLKNKIALYAHLRHCYWYSQFKDHIEDAPFFRKIPSKQLRYYYRNRPEVIKYKRAKRKLDKDNGISVNTGSLSKIKRIKLPKTLK